MTRTDALKPTGEQQAAMDAFTTGQPMVLEAGAGTGKTSTLKLMAAARPDATGVYLAYNKVTATDAQKTFPRSVEARTAHSYAYRWLAAEWGPQLQRRLNAPRQPGHVTTKLVGVHRPMPLGDGIILGATHIARIAMETVGRFCNSADTQPSRSHVPKLEGLTAEAQRAELAAIVVPLARKVWADMTRPDGQHRFTHDAYLKMWSLSQPTLPGDYVMLDEAQDTAPVVAAVFNAQDAQRVAVGDACQSIYGWRGATDALTTLKADHRLLLTQSWRFGQAIADEANKWLDLLDADLRLTGNPGMQSTVQPTVTPAAVLCRTNAEAVARLMACHETGTAAAIVGGAADVKALAEAAEQLKATGQTYHRELCAFTSWGQVQDYCDADHGGQDLKVAVHLIDKYGADAIIAAIDKSVPEHRAQVVLSTAHKAKGREWASVKIANDFPEPKRDEDGETLPGREELMLAYVAVTRARMLLDPSGVTWINRYASTAGGDR